MLKTIVGLQGVTVLSKDAQKKIYGGYTCGTVATNIDGTRCLADSGISKAEAKNLSAAYNLGELNNGTYSGFTDLNWCCASCGNFAECPGDI